MPIIDKTMKLFLFLQLCRQVVRHQMCSVHNLYSYCWFTLKQWSAKKFLHKIFWKWSEHLGLQNLGIFGYNASQILILDDWWNGYLCYYRKVSRGFSQYSAVLCKIFSVNQYLTSWGFGATAISLLIMSLIYWMDVQYSISYNGHIRGSFSMNFNKYKIWWPLASIDNTNQHFWGILSIVFLLLR